MRKFFLSVCFCGMFCSQLIAMNLEESSTVDRLGASIEAEIKSLSNATYPQNLDIAKEIINNYLQLDKLYTRLEQENKQLKLEAEKLYKEKLFYEKQVSQLSAELSGTQQQINQCYSLLNKYSIKLKEGVLSNEEYIQESKDVLDILDALVELHKTAKEGHEQSEKILETIKVQLDNSHNRRSEVLSQTCSRHFEQSKISKAISKEEIRRMARNYLKNEISGAEKLKTIFKADEVRIVDAQSIVEGLFLNEERKNYYLNLLKKDDIESNLIEFFNGDLVQFKKGPFMRKDDNGRKEFFLEEDGNLRRLVQRCAIEGSDNSVVFRNLMTAYMASVEALRISTTMDQTENIETSDLKKIAQIPPENNLHMIKRGTNSFYHSERGEVSLNVDEDFYQYSFFKGKGSFAQKLDGRFVCKDEGGLEYTIFHEFGHYIFPCIPWQCYGMGVMRKLINMRLSDEEKNWALYNRKFTDKIPEEESGQSLEIEQQLTDEDIISEHEDSISISLFHAPAEVLQIMGLMLLNEDGRTVLYINKISDFALNADQRTPIRSDHTGWIGLSKTVEYLQDNRLGLIEIGENESLDAKNERGTTIHKKYQIPVEVYGALFDILGMSFEGYVSGLMYPDLQSSLQRELELSHEEK